MRVAEVRVVEIGYSRRNEVFVTWLHQQTMKLERRDLPTPVSLREIVVVARYRVGGEGLALLRARTALSRLERIHPSHPG